MGLRLTLYKGYEIKFYALFQYARTLGFCEGTFRQFRKKCVAWVGGIDLGCVDCLGECKAFAVDVLAAAEEDFAGRGKAPCKLDGFA